MDAPHYEINAPTAAEMADAELIQTVARIGRTLRRRFRLWLATTLIIGLLGGIHYATAPRLYRTTATLLIQPTDRDPLNSAAPIERAGTQMLPTYQHLFHSKVVLERALQKLNADAPQALAEFDDPTTDRRVARLQDRLVAQILPKTNLIQLAFDAKNAEFGVTMVSAVVDSYLQFMQDSHRDVAAELVTILHEERHEVEERLRATGQKLIDAKQRVGDLGLRQGDKVLHPLVQSVTQINEAIVAIRQKRVQLESSLAAVRSAIRSGGDLRQHLLSLEPMVGREVVLGALGLNAQDAEATTQLEQELRENRAQLASLTEHLGDAHPRVVNLQQAIDDTQVSLAEHQSRMTTRTGPLDNQQLGPMLLRMVEEELVKVWSQERDLQAVYARTEAQAVRMNGQLAELDIIENDLQLQRNWHDTLRARIANLDLTEDQADVRVFVVSPATPEPKPVSPRPFRLIFSCVFAALVFGGGLAYVAEALDDRFQTPEELRDQLGANVLAIIRRLPDRPIDGLDSLETLQAPESVECEAFRTLRTALALAEGDMDCLVISSSEPGDGKTTVLANLGVAMAQAGKRTLLIDADMRRPGLTKRFRLRGATGLSDLLRDSIPVVDSAPTQIRPSGVENLDILPCGARPSDPTSLLGDARLSELLNWSASRYQQILIDTPPVLAASDAAIAARLAGGMALVVQPEKNYRRTVCRAVDGLKSLGVVLSGVIVNRVAAGRESLYYGSGYGYRYHSEDDDSSDQTDYPACTTAGHDEVHTCDPRQGE